MQVLTTGCMASPNALPPPAYNPPAVPHAPARPAPPSPDPDDPPSHRRAHVPSTPPRQPHARDRVPRGRGDDRVLREEPSAPAAGLGFIERWKRCSNFCSWSWRFAPSGRGGGRAGTTPEHPGRLPSKTPANVPACGRNQEGYRDSEGTCVGRGRIATMIQCSAPEVRPNGRRRRLSNVLPLIRWLFNIGGARSAKKPKPPK